MKKKIFIVAIIFILVISIFYCYKFFIPGNNKTIKDVNELDEYILGMKNYTLEAKITVNSNKNTNTYLLKETNENGKSIQEIISEGTNSGVVLEYEDEKLTIKNTELGLPRIFADYKELFNNPIDFMTFVQDYKSDDKKDVKIKDDYYIVSVKTLNSSKYTTHKVLYFSRSKNQIERIEIKDINNNQTIIIEYSSFKLL